MHVIYNFRVYKVGKPFRSTIIQEINSIYNYMIMSTAEDSQGCKNIRDGGESIKADQSGPFLVYLVYRSFQKPPS